MRSYLTTTTTTAERLRALAAIFASCLVAGLASHLAVLWGWPVAAPIPPLAAGWLLGRGHLGGWLVLPSLRGW
jgi:hypothetical protein